MPEIKPGVWKIGAAFYWTRKHADGKSESEFDLVDGHPTLWGQKTPTDLVEVSWQPMTVELASKIARYGEFGIPVSAPSISIKVKDGEVPIVYRDNAIVRGLRIKCKSCNHEFNAISVPDNCPRCKAEAEWGTFVSKPHVWEESVYGIGIEDRYGVRFGPTSITIE